MSVVVGYDAIHANIAHLPHGQAAGYTTGTPDIRWTAADWQAHPGAVRICQDINASDHTADALDVERFAAINTEAAAWVKAARDSYITARRPGQRSPAIYTSASNVTPLVNALTAGGVKGCGLWVANWNLSWAEAYDAVASTSGPFPVIGVQWSSGAFYDSNVFDGAWLTLVSGTRPAPHPAGGDEDMYQLVFRDGHASVAFKPGQTHLRLWANNTNTLRANLEAHKTELFTIDASTGPKDLDITGARGGVIRLDAGDGDIAVTAW